jgi:CBS domain containing-hemolysin-like protein
MTATLIVLVALILASGFFSGSEIALFSISRARARGLLENERRGAAALVSLKSNPERLLVTLLIGNNVANIGAAAVATYSATMAFGSAGVGIATGVMTLMVLFFGEIVPKSIAARNAESFALFIAPFVVLLSRLLTPISLPFVALTRVVVPQSTVLPSVTEAEIRSLTEIGHRGGAIEEHERELIERAFLLDSTRAWQIMTPRVDIEAWPDDTTLSDIARELDSIRYSRIPIYSGSLDDITGVVHVRDAYRVIAEGRAGDRLSDIAREPFFVPATIPLIQLLGEFRGRRVHLGIVVDEHGGTDGLVTLEDILEELVGEIDDELDRPVEPVRRIGRDEIIADASVDLKEINQAFGLDIPVSEHRSLNGLLLESFGRVPKARERIEIEDVEIEVIEAGDTQVTRVRVRRITDEDVATD